MKKDTYSKINFGLDITLLIFITIINLLSIFVMKNMQYFTVGIVVEALYLIYVYFQYKKFKKD